MNIICLHMIHMHIQMCIYNVHMHIDIKQVQHTKQGTPKSKCVHRHDRRWLHEHKLFMYLCTYIYTHIYHKVSSVCLQELEAAAAAQKAWFRDNHRMYMFRATGVTVVPGWARFFCYFTPSFYQPGLGEQRAFSPGCRCCA